MPHRTRMTKAMPKDYELWIGRDSAHVLALSKTTNHAKIITAADFFQKVALSAYIDDPHLRKNPEAALLLATEWLLKNKTHPPYFAKDYVRLFDAFFHGMCPPSLVLSRLEENDYTKQVLSGLTFMEEKLGENHHCTSPLALFKALLAISQENTLPHFLRHIEKVRFCYLIDLTLLEINVIKMLAALGLSVEILLPMDFQKRGLNAVIDFIAKQFEKDGDENNIDLLFDDMSEIGGQKSLIDNLFLDTAPFRLNSEQCSIEEHPHVLSSANIIANQILCIKHRDKTATIALVARTKDYRLSIFKNALKNALVPYNDVKGTSLLSTTAGRFFTLLFRLRRDFLKKSDVLAYFCHPFQDIRPLVPHFEKILDEIHVPIAKSIHESAKLYEEHLAHFARHHESLKDEALALQTAMANLYAMLLKINDTDTFVGHSKIIRTIFETFNKDHKSDDLTAILTTLDQFLAIDAAFLGQLSLEEYATLQSLYFGQIFLREKTSNDAHAVQILSLPEVLGKSFDHIFLIDMNFGRMPKTVKEETVFDDKTRLSINKLMGRPVLRVFLEDPFEPMPVPPRQALEPFFFATAIAQATNKVWFSRPKMGVDGKDEIPSDFFTWLTHHVILETLPPPSIPFVGAFHARFFEGQKAQATIAMNDDESKKIHLQRMKFEANQQLDDYAFRLSEKSINKAFKGPLHGVLEKVITPTFVENFSECRFKGLLDRVVLNTLKDVDEDLDIRLLGSIAHKCLELYFKSDVLEKKSYEAVALKVASLVDSVIAFEANKAFMPNIWLVHCHGLWLKSALTKLVYKMQSFMAPDFGKSYTELSFGLSDFSKNKAVTIRHQEKNYRIGGIIDRLIIGKDEALILDYKLSSIASLRRKIRPDAFLQSHFQVPIYLRLVADTYPKTHRSIRFMLLSIRDGEMLAPIALSDSEELYQKIVNDDYPNSMSKRIDEILSPLSRGEVAAQKGPHCDECRHSFICRKDDFK